MRPCRGGVTTARGVHPHTAAPVTDLSARISPVVEKHRSDDIRPGPHIAFSFAAAGWLTTLAIPLLAFPRVLALVFGLLLVEMSDPDAHSKPGADVLRTLNILERSLAGMAGLSCLALAAVLVVQTGAIPFTNSPSASQDLATASVAAPYRTPTIRIANAFLAGLAYTSYSLGLLFVAVPSGVLAVYGVWVLLFAHEGRVNESFAKASSFPFKNIAAEEAKSEERKQR